MDELFGELRSMVASVRVRMDHWELKDLLERAFALDEDRYREEWIPYLAETDKVPVFFCSTLDELALTAKLLPEGAAITFSIEGSKFDYDAFANAPQLASLTGITISYKCNLTDTRFARLMESPHLGNLTRLDVGGNKLGDGAMEALARATSVHRLEYLRLYHNEIGANGAEALAGSPGMTSLTTLDISVNTIQDAGIAAIGASSHLGNLRKLVAFSNKITRRGAEDFAKTTTLVNLTELSLGQNNIGNYGAQALANCAALKNLTSLDVSRARVNKKGATYLRESEHLTNIERLYH